MKNIQTFSKTAIWTDAKTDETFVGPPKKNEQPLQIARYIIVKTD